MLCNHCVDPLSCLSFPFSSISANQVQILLHLIPSRNSAELLFSSSFLRVYLFITKWLAKGFSWTETVPSLRGSLIPALKITDFPFTLLYCTISRALYLAFSHPAPLQTSLCVFLKGTLALVSDPILKTFPMFPSLWCSFKASFAGVSGKGSSSHNRNLPQNRLPKEQKPYSEARQPKVVP